METGWGVYPDASRRPGGTADVTRREYDEWQAEMKDPAKARAAHLRYLAWWAGFSPTWRKKMETYRKEVSLEKKLGNYRSRP